MNIMNIMRSTFFKSAFASASLVLAVGHVPIALAHVQGGSLGPAAGATDLYLVACSDRNGLATARLSTRVRNDNSGSAKVSVQTREGSVATNTTDSSGGDIAYSPTVYNNSGNGGYYVLVNKTTSGAYFYVFQYFCESASGVITGTAITTLQ